jgi:hypothetical protein
VDGRPGDARRRGLRLQAPEAQQVGRVSRIGILTNEASDSAERRQLQAFRLGLRERGWIEGENI